MLAELKMVCTEHLCKILEGIEQPVIPNPMAMVKLHIEVLNAQDQLDCLGNTVKYKYNNVFTPILHLDELSTDVYCRIKLKDATQTIKTQSCTTPCKYKEAWATLIQQHLDASYIWPSNSIHASMAFLVPKLDASVLLCWVNDYCVLNANMVVDSHPLPKPMTSLLTVQKVKSEVKWTWLIHSSKCASIPMMFIWPPSTTPLGLYKMVSNAHGLVQFATHPPVMSNSHPLRIHRKNMRCISWQYYHLVCKCHRACQACQSCDGSPVPSKTILQRSQVSIFQTWNWFLRTLHLRMRNWTQHLQRQPSITIANLKVHDRCLSLFSPNTW